MKRRYPQTSLYHVLAAYGDVLARLRESQREAELYPFKLPPMTAGHNHMRKGKT